MKKRFTSLIFLAGGKGVRLNQETPKQYIPINGKILAWYSFELFSLLQEINEIIVVCSKNYKSFFKSSKSLTFAEPGQRRQDSVFNGLQKVNKASNLVCIHDAARPFIDKESVISLINAGYEHNAAVLAIPATSTIKEANSENYVNKTLDRSKLWEIQTPQAVKYDLLLEGFDYVNKNNIDVTDDVSIVELLNHPVKIVKGKSQNIKITTPFDLNLAKALLLT